MTNAEISEYLKIYVKYALLSAASTFAVFLPGILEAPNFEAGKALAVSAIVGTGTAVARALYGAIRSGELPFPSFGFGSKA